MGEDLAPNDKIQREKSFELTGIRIRVPQLLVRITWKRKWLKHLPGN
jgi:hypothetical protein